MQQYLDLLRHVLVNGARQQNRTGIDTYSVFGTNMVFDLRDGFPMVTTKKLHWPAIVHELLWFISGSKNISYLKENNVKIWNEWAAPNGDVGPMYGSQWRNWDGIDQLQGVIDSIKERPGSRRHIVNTWHVTHLPIETIDPVSNVLYERRMALAPCHMMYQFYVDPEGTYLDMQMYQRSVDVFLGLPFNIASYALLLSMIAQLTGYVPRNLYWVGGDTHLYTSHIEQAKLQLERQPYDLPYLLLDKAENINDYTFDHIHLYNYVYHPYIKAEIAV